MELREDMNFASRYELVKLIGKGEQTEVWLAKNSWSNEEVALKVFATREAIDDSGVSEMANAYNMNHPNLLIPTRVDAFDMYAEMKYCVCGSCERLIGKASESDVVSMVSGVAAALAFLHSKGLAHGNIKASNVLIDEESNFMLADMAKSSDGYGLLGGGKTEAMRDDIKALGALCFLMIEGRAPEGEIGRSDVSDETKDMIMRMVQGNVGADELARWADDMLYEDDDEEEEETVEADEEENCEDNVEEERKDDKPGDGICEDSDFMTVGKKNVVPPVVNMHPNEKGTEKATGMLAATFVFAFLGGLLGIILGILVYKNKKYLPKHRTLGLIGAIISAVLFVLYRIVFSVLD